MGIRVGSMGIRVSSMGIRVSTSQQGSNRGSNCYGGNSWGFNSLNFMNRGNGKGVFMNRGNGESVFVNRGNREGNFTSSVFIKDSLEFSFSCSNIFSIIQVSSSGSSGTEGNVFTSGG